MKNSTSLIRTLSSALLLISFVLLFEACNSNYYIQEEYDIVKKSERIRLLNYYGNSEREFGYSLTQEVIKETKTDSTVSYIFYDNLKVPSNAYTVSSKIYLIVDSIVFPIQVIRIENSQIKLTEPIEEEVILPDSSKQMIVSGYHTTEFIYVKFMYALDNETIELLKVANSFAFRYYSGPKMLTFQPSDKEYSYWSEFLKM